MKKGELLFNVYGNCLLRNKAPSLTEVVLLYSMMSFFITSIYDYSFPEFLLEF